MWISERMASSGTCPFSAVTDEGRFDCDYSNRNADRRSSFYSDWLLWKAKCWCAICTILTAQPGTVQRYTWLLSLLSAVIFSYRKLVFFTTFCLWIIYTASSPSNFEAVTFSEGCYDINPDSDYAYRNRSLLFMQMEQLLFKCPPGDDIYIPPRSLQT